MRARSIAIIGSGWRSECFLRVLKAFPGEYRVSGVVSRSERKRERLRRDWGVPAYARLDDLLGKETPDFVLVSVTKDHMDEVVLDTAARGIPVLAETPPAKDLEGLIALHRRLPAGARVQVAEQYFLYPMNQARFALMESGLLGEIRYAHVSVSHGYHGISLIRKALGIGFGDVSIRCHESRFPVVAGPGREGPPTEERIREETHRLAVLRFGPKTGLYDFEDNQHRSWARSCRFLVRGERGEIGDATVRFLEDYRTPVAYSLDRVNAGEFENMEGYRLKGIRGGGRWLYENPFGAPLSDDDIAMMTVVRKMGEYVDGGPPPYPLAEASQDQYLSLMMDVSAAEDREVRTEPQCWAEP